MSTLKHFIEIFSLKKHIFSGVVKMLIAKEQKLLEEKCQKLPSYEDA